MATLNKTFPFATTLEGFTGVPFGASMTMSYDGTYGNPSGSLKSRNVGRNKAGTSYWEWTGTWEDLGITPGTTVDQVRINNADNRCTEWNVGDAATIGPYSIYNSAGDVLIATLWAGRSPTGVEGSWTSIGNQTYQAIGASYQASNTSIRIRLYNTSDLGNNTAAAQTFYDDNISLDIDYVAGSDDLTAVGITANPVVGTPSIGQEHDLTAVGITTTPVVGIPVLLLIFILISVGIITTPVLGTPTITHIHVLTATGITVNPVVGTPTAAEEVLGPIATDDFNRTGPPLGSDWAAVAGLGLTHIDTNQAAGDPGSEKAAYWVTNTPNDDQYTSFKWFEGSGSVSAGPAVRANGSDMVFAAIEANAASILWWNGGAKTQIGSIYYGVPVEGGTYRLEAEGTTFRLYEGATLRASGSNVSAPASGGGGMYIYEQYGRLDDFEVGNLGATADLTAVGITANPVAATPTAEESIIRQSAKANVGQSPAPSDTITATFGSTPIEGNLLVACHFTGDNDSFGPAGWSEAFQLTDPTPYFDEGAIYYKIAGASEPTAVQCSSTSPDEHVLVILEANGPWESTPLDQIAEQEGSIYSVDADSGLTPTTTQANEFAVGLITTRTDTNSPRTITWLNSFMHLATPHSSDDPAVSGQKQLSVGTRLLSAAGTYKAAGTIDQQELWMAGIATFKLSVSDTDDLTSVGITANPVLDTPSIGQKHVLTATGITANPVLGTPTIGRISNLTPVDITANPVLGTPTITHIHVLTATGIIVNPTLGTPVLGAEGEDSLEAVGITVNPALGTPALAQEHALGAVGIAANPVLDTPSIERISNLTAVDIISTPVLGTPSIERIPNLDAVDIVASPVLSVPTVSRVSNLIAVGITANPVLDTPSIGQTHVLDAVDIISTPVLGTPVLGSEGEHTLEAVGITSDTVVGTPAIGQTHVVSSVGISTTPVTETPTIALVHILNATSITATPVVEESAIGQTHALSPTDITTTPVVGAPILSPICHLDATDITTTPTVETPTIGQTHVLDATTIIVSPIFGVPTIGQTHVLSAEGITTTPELGVASWELVDGEVIVTFSAFPSPMLFTVLQPEIEFSKVYTED